MRHTLAFAASIAFSAPAVAGEGDTRDISTDHSARATETKAPGRRIALVIGNRNYTVVSPLWSPIEDARAWADALQRSGFQVITCYDCTHKDMRARLSLLQAIVEPNDEVFFYYSGHGAEQNDKNVLFPVDARIAHCGDLDDWSISLNSVLGAMDKARVRIVVLDACRNAPFPTCTRAPAPGPFVDQSIPSGTLVAYATRRGYAANDGSGTLSPYTRAVLPLVTQPGMPMIEALTLARDHVRALAPGQEPFETTSLSGQPWTMVPGPHPEIREALNAEDRKRNQEALMAWVRVSALPDDDAKYAAVVAYLVEHGGTSSSANIAAQTWLNDHRLSAPPGPTVAVTEEMAAPPPVPAHGATAAPVDTAARRPTHNGQRRPLLIGASLVTGINAGLWGLSLANASAFRELEREAEPPLSESQVKWANTWHNRANGFAYAAEAMTGVTALVWLGYGLEL